MVAMVVKVIMVVVVVDRAVFVFVVVVVVVLGRPSITNTLLNNMRLLYTAGMASSPWQ